MDLENLCQIIQERLFDIPSQRRSLLDDLEVCIGGIDSISSENATVAEISLSHEMLLIVGRWLGNEERIRTLISSSTSPDRIFGEQLSEQLVRDGMDDSCTLRFVSSFIFIFFRFYFVNYSIFELVIYRSSLGTKN